MLKFKTGVDIAGIKQEMVLGILVINSVFEEYGECCTITAITDGKHKEGSLHYKGQAVDIRSKHLALEQKVLIYNLLKESLGTDFDVILEAVDTDNEHFHIEYDKK